MLLGDADVVVASGKRFSNSTMPEPSRIAGVMPTSRVSCSAMSHSHWPKTWVNVAWRVAAGGTRPIAGSNLPGPW
jgi:hypothetical protein